MNELIAKHDAAQTRYVRAKIALIIYSKFGVSKYLADHGEHITPALQQMIEKEKHDSKTL